MHPGKGPNGSWTNAPFPFDLVAIAISTIIAMPFLFIMVRFLPQNLVVSMPRMQTEEALFGLFQGLLTKG